ncbi:MAG: diacylglycerol kinase family protein [Bacteroidetes bacterium]|nr:diacylglycerol kinase family protein [Bacteroidota bacterium]
MPDQSPFRKRLDSFGHAFHGILFAVKTQINLKIHLLIAIVVIAVGFFFGISKLEWLIIILVIGMVISAEIFNTSIEILTDLVSPEENKKAGRVKDLAAGAVLVSAIAAVVLGLLIFLPKILSL